MHVRLNKIEKLRLVLGLELSLKQSRQVLGVFVQVLHTV